MVYLERLMTGVKLIIIVEIENFGFSPLFITDDYETPKQVFINYS